MLGSKKEFVITEAWTHGPGHGVAYRWSEPSVIPLSYSGTPGPIGKINVRYSRTTLFQSSLAFTPSISNTALSVGSFFYLLRFQSSSLVFLAYLDFNINFLLSEGSACGPVGITIASKTRGLLFESGHRQTLNYQYTVNCFEMTKKRKIIYT